MPKFLKTLIATIALFVIVNTAYFWSNLIGPWLIPLTLILALIYLVLVVLFLAQVVFSIREKLKSRSRLCVIGAMAILLAAIFIWPKGIINFYKLEGEDKVTAFRKGTANCTTTLHLKPDGKFILRNVCFGVNDLSGSYVYKNDTLKLDYSIASKPRADFQYGVLQPGKKTIYLYRSVKDNQPYPLGIVKGKLE